MLPSGFGVNVAGLVGSGVCVGSSVAVGATVSVEVGVSLDSTNVSVGTIVLVGGTNVGVATVAVGVGGQARAIRTPDTMDKINILVIIIIWISFFTSDPPRLSKLHKFLRKRTSGTP